MGATVGKEQASDAARTIETRRPTVDRLPFSERAWTMHCRSDTVFMVRRLRRHTILKQVACDLRQLPLSAAEGFVLTLMDGSTTLGDIADVHGMTLAQIFPPADRLLELGAVSIVGEKGAAPEAPDEPPPPRTDSKVLAASRRPTPTPGAAPRPTRPPPSRKPSQVSRPSHRPPARSKTPPAAPRAVAAEAGPALDEAVLARILTFAARLDAVDHYTLLAVERGAEKVTIKRAYFALAAEFHPDRHFGKALGQAGPALQRIFTRLTAAHDTLVSRARRAEYDALLPPAPATPAAPAPPEAPAPPPPAAPAAPARAPSRTLSAHRMPTRRSTRTMKSVGRSAATPAATPSPPPAATPALPPPPPAPVAAANTPARRAPQAEEAMRRLYNGAKQDEVRRHVRVFVDAAEAAMRRDDVVEAAHNYRLALQNHDDPLLRAKLAAIEDTSKERVHERNLARARSAERGERWADAASYFAQANAARPDAATAERAAHALRMSGGDLRRAAQLAEQAVLAEPTKAAYRVTLGEICLAASMVKRAAGEAERALAIDPTDTRAKALADAAAKKS